MGLLFLGDFLGLLLFNFLSLHDGQGVSGQPGVGDFVFPDQELNLETWGFVASLYFSDLHIIGVTAVLDAVDVFFSSILSLFLFMLVRLVTDPDVDSVVRIENHDIVVVEIFLHETEDFFHEHVSSTVGDVKESRLEINGHAECGS